MKHEVLYKTMYSLKAYFGIVFLDFALIDGNGLLVKTDFKETLSLVCYNARN